MEEKGSWPYEDIVDLEHPVSKKHPQMEMIRRAAQFAPFAALTGYEAAVQETARVTQEKRLLDEDLLEDLDRILADALQSGSRVCLTCFVPDEKKEGGRYRTVTGRIRRISGCMILLDDGSSVPADMIAGIEPLE